MLNNLTELFAYSPPSISNRKYQYQPKLINPKNKIQHKFHNYSSTHQFDSKKLQEILQGITDFLHTPIETWILQYQRSLHNYSLHFYIFHEIIKHSSSYNSRNISAAQKQNEMFQEIIRQIKLGLSLTVKQEEPKQQKLKVSLHNIFVLMTQYKVMNKFIENATITDLQMLIDGLAYIYFYGIDKKVENIGQILSEEQITQGYGNAWGTLDELTCCIHFIITNSKLYKLMLSKSDSKRQIKSICVDNLYHFMSVYQHLLKNNRIDNIINSIPMFMEFTSLLCVRKDVNNFDNCQFITIINWLNELGIKVMSILQYNISALLLQERYELGNFIEEHLKQQFELLEKLGKLNNYQQQPQFVLKLHKKAKLLKNTQGQITPRIMFSYAFHHLCTINFLIKLSKSVLIMSKPNSEIYRETCQKICLFLSKLFQCSSKYQFNIPEPSIFQINEIIKIICTKQPLNPLQSDQQDSYLIGISVLYLQVITNSEIKLFSKSLQKSDMFGYYHQGKPKPDDDWESISGDDNDENMKVQLSFPSYTENHMFYYILDHLYNHTIVEYLSLILIFLQKCDRRYLAFMQYFFIKNELLHYLIESRSQILIKDKRVINTYFSTLAYLIKGNYVAYAILDNILQSQQNENEKIQPDFYEYIRQNFPEAKVLISTVLSDSITKNNQKKQNQPWFCSQISKNILYRQLSQQSLSSGNPSKHKVWVSYIFNVIIQQLQSVQKKIDDTQKKRLKARLPTNYCNLIQTAQQLQSKGNQNIYQKQIFSWATFILLLHLDFLQYIKESPLTTIKYEQKNQQKLLSLFIMTYLPTILSPQSKRVSSKFFQTGRIIDYMRVLQQWQRYYTSQILNNEYNQDILQKEYGNSRGVIKFLSLKRLNKKILKTIKLYVQKLEQSMKIQQRLRKVGSNKSLQFPF